MNVIILYRVELLVSETVVVVFRIQAGPGLGLLNLKDFFNCSAFSRNHTYNFKY